MLSFYDFGSRYYDPEIGRWFNIDPALQMVGPYSYCNNNPIRYIDPDGEWIHIAIGALVGGIINVVTHWDEIGSFKDGLAAFGIGAVAGAVGAATGGVAFAGAEGAAAVLGSGGFLAGMAGGAAGTAFSMPLESLGNSLYFGDSFMTGSDYVLGVAGGGLLGGLINGGASVIKGQNFWNGSVSPSNVSTPRSSPKLDYELPQNKVVELPSTVSPAEIPDLPQPRLAPVPEKVYLTLDIESGRVKSFADSRSAISEWLQNAGKLERSQLINDIESVGFTKYYDDGIFMKYHKGDIIIRIDPPHKNTIFNHIHINYKKERTAYDILLHKVKFNSKEAHILIK